GEDQQHSWLGGPLRKRGRTDDPVAVLEGRASRVELEPRTVDPLHEGLVLLQGKAQLRPSVLAVRIAGREERRPLPWGRLRSGGRACRGTLLRQPRALGVVSCQLTLVFAKGGQLGRLLLKRSDTVLDLDDGRVGIGIDHSGRHQLRLELPEATASKA